MAAAVNEDEQEGALVDVGFERDQSEAGATSAPPGFCEKIWVSGSGGAGCFAYISPDVLRSLELLTGTDIYLEKDKIRVSGSRVSNVDAAMVRLPCLEKPFVSADIPSVRMTIRPHAKNNYSL